MAIPKTRTDFYVVKCNETVQTETSSTFVARPHSNSNNILESHSKPLSPETTISCPLKNEDALEHLIQDQSVSVETDKLTFPWNGESNGSLPGNLHHLIQNTIPARKLTNIVV